jgi:hypothetical protein
VSLLSSSSSEPFEVPSASEEFPHPSTSSSDLLASELASSASPCSFSRSLQHAWAQWYVALYIGCLRPTRVRWSLLSQVESKLPVKRRAWISCNLSAAGSSHVWQNTVDLR